MERISDSYSEGFERHVTHHGHGGIHLHVDGVGLDDALRTIQKQFEGTLGLPEQTAITQSAVDPLRQDHPKTYASRIAQGESYSYSTLDVSGRGQAISALRNILPILARHPGTVVEVEHVLFVLDEDGEWLPSLFEEPFPINRDETGFVAALRRTWGIWGGSRSWARRSSTGRTGRSTPNTWRR